MFAQVNKEDLLWNIKRGFFWGGGEGVGFAAVFHTSIFLNKKSLNTHFDKHCEHAYL